MASQGAHSAKHAVLVLVTVDDCIAHAFIPQPLLVEVVSVVVGPCSARHLICAHSEWCVACNVTRQASSYSKFGLAKAASPSLSAFANSQATRPTTGTSSNGAVRTRCPTCNACAHLLHCKQGQLSNIVAGSAMYLHTVTTSPFRRSRQALQVTCRSPKRSSFSGIPRCATSCLCRASLASASAVSVASSSSLNDVTVTPRRRRTALKIPVSETNRLNTRYKVRDASARSQTLTSLGSTCGFRGAVYQLK